MATTPPPSSGLRIPPTPQHGPGYDRYSPYSTRHSARLATQRSFRNSHTTPPPNFPDNHAAVSPRSARKQRSNESETLSPPVSTRGSSQKKPSSMTRGFVPPFSARKTPDLDISDPFDTASASHLKQPSLFTHTTMADGMLPTPAKTPQKKPVGDMGSTARTLFPPNTMSGRKKTKKHTGFSLDSFNEDPSEVQPKIEIYTDSRDRIPELDESENNPFYTKSNPEEPSRASTRPSTRRNPGGYKRDKSVDEAVNHDEGMLCMFRGKRIFRKFDDKLNDEEEDDDMGLLASRPDLIDDSVVANVRPLTRSSIKPRVLFPSAHDRSIQHHHASDADEEAATDIEDHVAPKEASAEASHAAEGNMQNQLVTPAMKTTIETPSSPGASMRSLRSRTRLDGSERDATPTGQGTKKKRVSPFDGWLRKKESRVVGGSKTRKRDAESVGSPGGPVPKRSRPSRTAVA